MSPRPLLSSVLAVVVSAVSLSGCLFQNASPTVRLRDNVVALNSDLRWGRIDLALQFVAPTYRRKFVTVRTSWGEDVQIADQDVVGVRVVDDEDAAISTVDVRWFSYATMAIRETRVQQRWERQGRDYYLADEAVAGGDARLLPGVPVVEDDLGLGAEEPGEGEPGEDGDDLPRPTLDVGVSARSPSPT